MQILRPLLFTFFLCSAIRLSAQTSLKEGTWRGVITLSEKKYETILPFNFIVSGVKKYPAFEIINAEEKIKVTEISFLGDSVNFRMPVFDSEFRTILKNDTLRGVWINYAKKDHNVLPFEAYYNDKARFVTDKPANVDFSGTYEVTFDPKGKDEYKALGKFKQNGNKITGTFLTETGDYRYLEGSVQNNDMSLSCFDGAHAFLFYGSSANAKGKVENINGKAFYGATGREDWIAVRNEDFKLRDPESLTKLTTTDENINFTFNNLKNELVTLTDGKFQNKVVIIQLMGSWCPNCMDETAYLAEFYKKYKSKGLEIIGIAYEKTTDLEKAKNNLLRLVNRYGIEYEILMTGLSGKDRASESMPFLNGVMAFPTTIILDRKHKVQSIYTGFSGPATGKDFERYKAKNESLITELLLKK
jgi:thiol-disulfide isomerase/thioredoxin